MDTYDLQINQGETFTLSLSLTDSSGNALNLSGCVLSGFLKFKYSDVNKLMDLAPAITDYTNGVISVTLSSTGTAALPITKAVYDIESLNTGNGMVTKILAGKALIYPEVTY